MNIRESHTKNIILREISRERFGFIHNKYFRHETFFNYISFE